MQKYTTILLCICIFFTYGFCFETCPPSKWTRSYKDISFSPGKITNYNQSTFLITSGNKVSVINKSDGSVTKTVSGFTRLSSLVRTTDNKCIVTDKQHLKLLDNNLNSLWIKPLTDSSKSLISAFQIQDSGYAALNHESIFITDKNGTTVKTIPLGLNEQQITLGFAVTDSGYFVYGIKPCDDGCLWVTDGWLARYSSNGAKIWTKVLTGFQITDLTVCSNSSVVLTGTMDPNSAALQKRSYFPERIAPIIQVSSDGSVVKKAQFSIGGGKGGSVRVNGDYFVVTLLNEPRISATMSWIEVIGLSKSDGKLKWSKSFDRPKNDVSIPLLLAQPLTSDELALFIWDSLSYYSFSTDIHKPVIFNAQSAIITTETRQGIFEYNLNETARVKLQLYSMNGKSVACRDNGYQDPGRYIICRAGISSGTYLLVFQSNNQRITRKLIFGSN